MKKINNLKKCVEDARIAISNGNGYNLYYSHSDNYVHCHEFVGNSWLNTTDDCIYSSRHHAITDCELRDIIAQFNLYYRLNIDEFENSRISDIHNEYLSKNTCRNGRDVWWYVSENRDGAIYVDTMELLTQQEVEEQLL